MLSRIIFIPGILTIPQLQRFQWGNAAQEKFPGRDIVCLRKVYLYTQHQILQDLRDEALTIVKDQQPTTLVGHSFGGIIATAVAHHVRTHGSGNIVQLLTLATPHTLQAPGLAKARQMVGYLETPLDIPVHTYAARLDHVVPRRYTHYPGQVSHSEVWGTHSGFWLNPRSPRYHSVWKVLER